MHSKIMIVDDDWAMAARRISTIAACGSTSRPAASCTPASWSKQLDAAYQQDVSDSLPLCAEAVARRPLVVRVVENACRLLAPTFESLTAVPLLCAC